MKRNRSGYETLNYASLFAIAASAALYGMFLSVHPNHRVLSKIFSFSIATAITCFVIGTGTQIFVYKGAENGPNC